MTQHQPPLEPGLMYHIWTHANGSENLFRTEENYKYFLDKYSYYIQPVAETYAYCLMPNHVHLMVKMKEQDEMLDFIRLKKSNSTLQGIKDLTGFASKQFSNLFNAYAKSYNKMYQRRGSLFERPFKRKPINTDSYFATLIAYIHNNSVHHGFTEHPNEWPHSSWHAYMQDKPTNIKRDEGIEWFGNKNNFINFHREIRMEKLISLFEE